MFGFQTQSHTSKNATLYAIVFGSVYVKCAVMALFVFMLLQPIAQAQAAEEGAVESAAAPVQAEPEPEPEPEVVQESEVEEVQSDTDEETQETQDVEVVENDQQAEDVDLETDEHAEVLSEGDVAETSPQDNELGEASVSSGETDQTNTQVEEGGVTVDADELVSSSTVSSLPDATVTSSTSSDDVSEPTESSGGGSTNAVNETDSSSSTIPEVLNESSSSTLATSTGTEISEESLASAEPTISKEEAEALVDEMVRENLGIVVAERENRSSSSEDSVQGEVAGIGTTTVPEAVYLDDKPSDDPLHFSTKDCVAVADGSFYCKKAETTTAYNSDSVVWAAQDSDGDFEIIFNDGKKEVKLTNNNYDDLSPSYDPVSDTVVWHRLIDSRYQIISYDLNDELETQLTNERFNNMEPSHENGVTVWQAWQDGNWEIMLHSGASTTRLTQNGYHDIAPDIQGGFVMWQTSNAGAKGAAVYEIDTGLTSLIDDSSGGQVMNPRFVLVYDTKFGNGDVITKGYDPETGDVVPLSGQPGDLPPKLPSPEPTGETQALIQNKAPGGRGDGGEDLVGMPPLESDEPNAAVSASSTSVNAEQGSLSTTSVGFIEIEGEPGTLDLSTTTEEAPLPLTDYDLIVEPFTATTSSADNSAEVVEVSDT